VIILPSRLGINRGRVAEGRVIASYPSMGGDDLKFKHPFFVCSERS